MVVPVEECSLLLLMQLLWSILYIFERAHFNIPRSKYGKCEPQKYMSYLKVSKSYINSMFQSIGT